jgi:hypothetical protein
MYGFILKQASVIMWCHCPSSFAWHTSLHLRERPITFPSRSQTQWREIAQTFLPMDRVLTRLAK